MFPAFAVIALLIASTQTIVLAQNGENQKIKAERLLEILEATKLHARNTLTQLKGQGVPIPETAENRFNEGISKAEEAVQLYNAGNFKKASEKAVEALHRFKEALAQAGDIEETEAEAKARGVIDLKEAIKRTAKFISDFESLVDELSTRYDISIIRGSIEEAKIRLDKAVTLAEGGRIEEAAKELGKAHQALSKPMNESQRISKVDKTRLVETFIGKTEERLSQIENRILSLPIPPIAKQAVQRAFQNARSRLAEATNLRNMNNIDAAIDQLEEAADILSELESKYGK